MAAGDLYIECEGGGKTLIASSGLLEVLNALAVKTSTGKHGLRAVTSAAAAADITALVPCGAPLMGWEELLLNLVVESASGAPAIGLITES
jgi:hypothetical protein